LNNYVTSYAPNDRGVAPALSEAEVTEFFDQGFVVMRGVASAREVDAYARAVLALLPRDLTVPEDWHAHAGRFKPYRRRPDGSIDDCIDIPELLPLFCNRRLYEAAAQLLGSQRVRIFDGSVGITMRNLSSGSPRSQDLHVDASVPKEVDDFSGSVEELQVGGCLYLTDVLPSGGGIHVVPGGHRWVLETAAVNRPGGRHLHHDWKHIPEQESVEVTGQAGDFAMLHHLIPHAASHNRRPAARLAVFLRYIREDHPYAENYLQPRKYNDAQLSVLDTLGRRLLGLDRW
jgi:ectoine hydroxylase-related dioxygenase (phytanoyl-CoA dioxygenase family)